VAALVAALLLLTAGAPLLVRDIQRQLDALAGRLYGGGLRTGDRVRVAGLNLAMGLGGLAVGYREVAAETLWLFFPGEPKRVWHSDFAMGSPRVRRALRELLEEARRRGEGRTHLQLPPRGIAWSPGDLERDSPRVALALNSPLRLEATAYRQAGGWRLEVRGRVAVRYPRRSRTLLGRLFDQELVIEEGLFADLQHAGWLHPFEAVWCWSVTEADPRLQDLSPNIAEGTANDGQER